VEQVHTVGILPTDSLDLALLGEAARSEGYRFVDRAHVNWLSGEDRFDSPGEGLFLARRRTAVVGMCGLNINPYLDDPGTGRLRRLYVASEYRRMGVGRRLVGSCLDLAQERFDRVRLRTFGAPASHFYEALGFRPIDEPNATHSIGIAEWGRRYVHKETPPDLV
jgi:GNAT superfamily N-acetyltransferase